MATNPFKGPQSVKVTGGLGRRNPSEDAIFGYVMGGEAETSNGTDYNLGDIIKLIQTSDLEDYGIDAAYDANNDVLVYHHIKEHFKYHPDSTVYLKLVKRVSKSSGNSLTDMLQASVNANAAGPVENLLLDPATNGEIKYVGVALNPVVDPASADVYSATVNNGIDADFETAVPKAQELVNHMLSKDYYLDGVAIEGRQADPTNVSFDLSTQTSESVSGVIAADPEIKNIEHTNTNNTTYKPYEYYGAVGAMLGMLSVRKVNENLGAIQVTNNPDANAENYPLTDKASSRWLKASFSGGSKTYQELTEQEIKNLNGLRYIFAGSYGNYPGVYFNDSHTATELSSDYAYIENNRTWNKAARGQRQDLLPKIKSSVDINKDTGYIDADVVANWEALAKKQLDQMLADDEISAGDTIINPKQNVLAGNPITVQTTIVPKGIAREITNQIGFDNPFS